MRSQVSNISEAKNQSTVFMDNAYTFDDVGNILGVSNNASPPSGGGGFGGQMSHTYAYDGLYRLATAEGTYTGADTKTASYSLEMGYDNMHNITSKKQHIEQTDIAFEGNLLAGYELEYNYSTDKPHQLSTITDNKYRTADSTAVASATQNLSDAYHYDNNGNLIFVNSSDSVQTNLKERSLLWDEENRLRAINDNGYVSSYFYDAGGERTVKLHGAGEGIHVNSAFSGGYTNNANYTLYVNAYMVLEKGGQYTKHIYIGDQRIVSKLGDVGSFGVDPRREQYAGEDVSGTDVPDYKTKYKALQQVIKDNYELFEVDYYAIDNDNYVDGEGFCCGDSPQLKSIPVDNVDYEKLQYYYHSDHLGSASYITNLDGEVVQHVEYVPFGEVFIEERNNTWNTPYLFNGKELDEETGLYYYGARYYNPRTSLWLSVDPLAEKYPSMSPYNYCANNPVVFVDPDGNVIVPIILYYLGKRVYNENISKWNRLNNHERHIIKWDPEFYKALDIEKNATETTTMTRKQYGRNGKGDESDAFRHTFWQARNTQDVGEDFTRKFTDAHEYGTPLEEIDTDLVMDIHNNEVGIEIGNNNLDATPEELVNIIQKRMADGDMLILKGGKLVKSNGEEVKAGEVRGLNKSMDIGNVIFQEPEKQKGKQYEKIE